jgi:translation initiation factor 2 beta subunit (eIF-2beta)/eIF-5
MMFFRRKKDEALQCAHSWYLADYESRSFNAGIAVEIDDYFVLRCSKCGAKRIVDEYEFGKLQKYGLVKEAPANA